MELSGTIPALLTQQTAAHASETILRKKDRGIWNAITWSDLNTHVREIGQGLRAIGLAAGEVVAILTDTRPEQVYTDLAVLGAGGVSVALHPDDEAARVGEILRETNAALAVVQGEEQLDKILEVRAGCPSLRRIVIIDMKGLREFQDPRAISLTALVDGGSGQSDWTAVMASVKPDQAAAILMPRTGVGRTVTHADLIREIDESATALGIQAGDERLAVLPMSDPAERIQGLYLSLKHRVISDYLENPETATENLREVKPTVFGADVEAWERLHGRISMLAAAATPVQKALYRWAINSGGGGLANLLVLPAVRAELGFGRLRVAFVGEGSLPPEVSQWAKSLGVTVRTLKPR